MEPVKQHPGHHLNHTPVQLLHLIKRNLKPREVKGLAQGYPATWWPCWDHDLSLWILARVSEMAGALCLPKLQLPGPPWICRGTAVSKWHLGGGELGLTLTCPQCPGTPSRGPRQPLTLPPLQLQLGWGGNGTDGHGDTRPFSLLKQPRSPWGWR